jgi:hypothetical protein
MDIETETLQGQNRKLKAQWTVEAAQDLAASFTATPRKELAEVLAQEINAEIDREILEDSRRSAQEINAEIEIARYWKTCGGLPKKRKPPQRKRRNIGALTTRGTPNDYCSVTVVEAVNCGVTPLETATFGPTVPK